MSEVVFYEVGGADGTPCECANCGWRGPARALGPIADYEERVSPGELTPAGECPQCGALSYLTRPRGPPMKPTRTHHITVRVEFDKICSRSEAVEAVRDTMGTDFLAPMSDATRFTVTGAKSAKRHKARVRFIDPRRITLTGLREES